MSKLAGISKLGGNFKVGGQFKTWRETRGAEMRHDMISQFHCSYLICLPLLVFCQVYRVGAIQTIQVQEQTNWSRVAVAGAE